MFLNSLVHVLLFVKASLCFSPCKRDSAAPIFPSCVLPQRPPCSPHLSSVVYRLILTFENLTHYNIEMSSTAEPTGCYRYIFFPTGSFSRCPHKRMMPPISRLIVFSLLKLLLCKILIIVPFYGLLRNRPKIFFVRPCYF